jgi:hypothetical protein
MNPNEATEKAKLKDAAHAEIGFTSDVKRWSGLPRSQS